MKWKWCNFSWVFKKNRFCGKWHNLSWNFEEKKDILAKRVQPLMSFQGKKKDSMENGEISYELLMKGQNLVTKLIVILGYNLI